MIFYKNVNSRQQPCYFNKINEMTSVQTFTWQISDYFRKLAGNIFLGVFFDESEILNRRPVVLEKRDRSAKICLKLPKFQNILSFLSTSRKASIVEFLIRQQAAECSLEILSKREIYYIHFSGYFPKFSYSNFKIPS